MYVSTPVGSGVSEVRSIPILTVAASDVDLTASFDVHGSSSRSAGATMPDHLERRSQRVPPGRVSREPLLTERPQSEPTRVLDKH